jgi:serine protease Do
MDYFKSSKIIQRSQRFRAARAAEQKELSMSSNSYFKNVQRQMVYALRRYPLQILGAGMVVALFFFVVSFSLILPHKTHGQSLQNGDRSQLVGSNTEDKSHQPLTANASYADLVDKVAPAVVTIRSEKKVAAQAQQDSPFNEQMLRQFFGGQIPQGKQQPQVERGLGSGVIVESNGTILTNNHVVDGASIVKVDLPDKRTFDAKVVGTDPASDLAVLKIDAKNLPTLSLGNSDGVRVGDVVLAIGNPLGLRQTVTSGIISAKSRQTGLSDGSFEDFLQTDAPINQGNSGGALVNLNGELIGINSQIMSPSGGSIGIGFAIPSNMAKSVMSQLIAGGKVHRGMLGVGIQDVTSELAENFGLKNVRGVIVNSITPGGPADKAGLKQGDVITSLNGANLRDGNDLRNHVAQTAPNSDVTLGYLRNGSEYNAKVTLGEFQAKKDDADNSANPNAEPTSGKLGLTLQPLTPQIADQLELKNVKSGLVVADVQAGSPADDAGIEQGDVIMQVNRQDVKSLEDVKSAMTKGKNNSILLLINRGGQTLFVTAAV